MEVIDAIRGRASTRAFLEKEVSRETLETVLEAARWAPSGVNTQPWQVAVAGRKAMARIGDRIVAALDSGAKPGPDYQYSDLVRAELGMESSLNLICGIALGYADAEDPVNNYRTEREPLEEFVKWCP